MCDGHALEQTAVEHGRLLAKAGSGEKKHRPECLRRTRGLSDDDRVDPVVAEVATGPRDHVAFRERKQFFAACDLFFVPRRYLGVGRIVHRPNVEAPPASHNRGAVDLDFGPPLERATRLSGDIGRLACDRLSLERIERFGDRRSNLVVPVCPQQLNK